MKKTNQLHRTIISSFLLTLCLLLFAKFIHQSMWVALSISCGFAIEKILKIRLSEKNKKE